MWEEAINIPGLSTVYLGVDTPCSSEGCVGWGGGVTGGHGERARWVDLVVVDQGGGRYAVIVGWYVRRVDKYMTWLLHVIVSHAGWWRMLLVQALAKLLHLHLVPNLQYLPRPCTVYNYSYTEIFPARETS